MGPVRSQPWQEPMPPGLTPGVSLLAVKKGVNKCGNCAGAVLVGQIKDPDTATLKWRNFEAAPIERGGLRYYRRHYCPR